MKIVAHNSGTGRATTILAFTIPEMVMAVATSLIVIGCMAASDLFGLRIMEKVNDKGSASAEARANILTLMNEVCSSKNALVGTGGLSFFTETGMDAPQKGAALQIYLTSDTNAFIRYYWDSTAKTLNRMTNGSATVSISSGITNYDLFSFEDWAGNVLSNTQNNCVVGLNLQYSQVQNANLQVGAGQFYTSYQVRSKIARRNY